MAERNRWPLWFEAGWVVVVRPWGFRAFFLRVSARDGREGRAFFWKLSAWWLFLY